MNPPVSSAGPDRAAPVDPAARGRALVLGVGNILWADEGFGVRCAEAFAARFAPTQQVEVADGGTQGLYLVDYFRDFDPIVIFDAMDFGDPPGTLKLVHDEAIPTFVHANKMSLHQAGLQDVIACAQLLGGAAERMLLIGVQPVELEDYGGSLRDAVRARIPESLEIAAAYLAEHGFPVSPRTDDFADPRSGAALPGVMTPGLELDRYEAGRPSAEAACRIGDERVLSQAGGA